METFVLIKPDAVRNGHTEAILERLTSSLETRGFDFCMQTLQVQAEPALAQQHYDEHRDKEMFPSLWQFIVSGPVVVVRIKAHKGGDLVASVRQLLGAVGEPGTLRGDFGTSRMHNAVHASDSVTAADREIGLWFGQSKNRT